MPDIKSNFIDVRYYQFLLSCYDFFLTQKMKNRNVIHYFKAKSFWMTCNCGICSNLIIQKLHMRLKF